VAERVAGTLTEPLRSAAELRRLVDDEPAWRALFTEPLGNAVESAFADDTVRGVVLTDALIGTFAAADEDSLRQNRCFLYHVIGNGTGDWNVPVGGMGAVAAALARAAGGARISTGAEVTAVSPDGEVHYRSADGEHTVHGERVLVNTAPRTLARLLGEDTADDTEGAQLKVNMVLRRLPRLLDSTVDPAQAFAGTFHVNEGYQHLAFTHHQAGAGVFPSLPPCEIYCHSLTDPSILGQAERQQGAHTLTLFGLHMPARLFAEDPGRAKESALRATLDSLNSVLAEPIEDCLWRDADGAPCVEAKTPTDLEHELDLPSGHIFHNDLSWPYAAGDADIGTWGVETTHERILLCGSGATRGGGVSGIPGHNAAMAVLGAR
jgi:phytoene dehydrogenase-like protein